MVIELKQVTQETLANALNRIKESKKKKTPAKHFGALKRGLDGLEYQKEMRDGWK